MLKRAKLRNFQPHRRRTLEFDRQITTIIGPTDAGKTAILRALRWVFFNRPQGSNFKTRGTKFVKVEIDIGKHIITRTKGKKNSYKLDGQELVAFKTGVPDPIKDILNLSDINFQRQHDPVFWFSNTPGEVSKDLNRIVNLEVIDNTLAVVANKLRKAKTEVEVSQERLQAAKEERRGLKWAKEFYKEAKAVAKLEEKLERDDSQLAALDSLIRQIKASSSRIQAIPSFKCAQTLFDEASALESQEDALESIIGEIREAEQEVKRTEVALNKAEAEYHKARRGKCPVCGKRMT